jgi:hypothetical protein
LIRGIRAIRGKSVRFPDSGNSFIRAIREIRGEVLLKPPETLA